MNLKNGLLYLIFMCVALLSGCYKNENQDSAERRKNIQFVVKAKGSDYWNVVRAGADAAAREFNVNLNFTAPDNEKDINEQINIVNNAIEDNVDALILAATDYNALASVTKKVYDSKIPVVIVDSEVNTDKINSLIITDNFDAGKKAGVKLLEIVDKEASIAIMSFVKFAKNAEQREEGLLSVIAGQQGIKVVAKEYCNSDEELAYELTKKLLTENKNIDAFVALNASGAEGTAEAIEQMGLAGKVKLIAFDITPEEIEYIERGVIQATVIQNPFSMGYLGVKYAVLASEGVKTPDAIDTGSRVIDKNNMYWPENQKFVFPFIR